MKHYITESERYQIEVLLKEKYTVRQIAEVLGHKYHTLYKEIKKGIVKQLDTELREHYVYKADYAQSVYDSNVSNRGRNLKIGNDHELCTYIEKMIIEKKYSPEALLLHARNKGLKFKTKICFKTIYNYLDMGLFLQASNSDLPYKKVIKSKQVRKPRISMNNIKGESIDKRPEHVNERKEFGHWEMDTVYSARGQGKACLLVLSERMGRNELIIKLKDRTSVSVVRALDGLERRIGSKKFRQTFKTITCDNGVEFSDFKRLERSLKSNKKKTNIYYCHAYCSWERGTNENINRMIRRIYPKGTSFDAVSQKDIDKVQDWINNYPRKLLGGLSSVEFYKNKNIELIA